MIYPLPFTGLSASSHAQVCSHFSAPAGQSHLLGAGWTDGVSQSGNEKKDTSGKNKGTKQKTELLVGDGLTRYEEAKSSHDTEKLK